MFQVELSFIETWYNKFCYLICCVFWTAFRCLQHLKTGQTTFFQLFSNFFFLFKPFSVYVVYFCALEEWLCFLLLSLPEKWHRRDVTMHAVNFLGQGSSYLSDQRVPYLWLKKKGRERGKTNSRYPLRESTSFCMSTSYEG